MSEMEIGLGKSARRAYALDEIALAPSRRTRNPVDVDTSWQIDAFRFELPLLSAAMDSVTSPATAVAVGRLGGLGVLNLEGLWARYDDPTACYEEIAGLTEGVATTRRLQEIYAEPVKDTLIASRVAEIRAAGVTAAGAVAPQSAQRLLGTIRKAELDILVIQGTIVSAEHVSLQDEPLNLKTFIRQLDLPVIVGGCASYPAALHLMRTGAAGVLVGVGAGHTSITRELTSTSSRGLSMIFCSNTTNAKKS